jgi:hypothetical protein
MNWDPSDATFMGIVTGVALATFVLAIVMDARRLPLGRIKMVPWTMITIFSLFAVIGSGRLLIQDLMHG